MQLCCHCNPEPPAGQDAGPGHSRQDPITWPLMSAPPAGGRVLIASNRGPLSFTAGSGGSLSARSGGGGLVSGLLSVAAERDVLWVCAALSDADRAAARRAPGGRLGLDGSPGGAGVRLLDIPPATFDAAYNKVANSVLWFVQHLLYSTPHEPQFGAAFQRDWDEFRRYNAAFAAALASAPGAGRAVVQDYHLSLVPRMLAERRPGIRIAHFTHTPWAPPEYFRILPDTVGREILEGMLGADHAGFLCLRWADAFLDCCAEILGAAVDRTARQVRYRGHLTTVGVHPLGVDAAELTDRAAQPDVLQRAAALAEAARGCRLIVRVDRSELSKNIIRGLAAFRELLVTRPQWHGKVTHVAFAYPSRTDIPEYRAYTDDIQRLAQMINEEFGTPDWQPLMLEVLDDYARSLAAYLLADVLLVNPIRDGMNLVAKEGPILSRRGCAVVLSAEAGAADELGSEALLINPYDISATAEALHAGLAMPAAERVRRSQALARVSAAMPPRRWFDGQLAALDHPGEPDPVVAAAPVPA
jgi:trehalose 6-phosphate synthase